MKTTLSPEGRVDIPKEILAKDHLTPGESFHVTRLARGEYLLSTLSPTSKPAFIKTGKSGRKVLSGGGKITMQMVQEIESRGY